VPVTLRSAHYVSPSNDLDVSHIDGSMAVVFGNVVEPVVAILAPGGRGQIM